MAKEGSYITHCEFQRVWVIAHCRNSLSNISDQRSGLYSAVTFTLTMSSDELLVVAKSSVSVAVEAVPS